MSDLVNSLGNSFFIFFSLLYVHIRPFALYQFKINIPEFNSKYFQPYTCKMMTEVVHFLIILWLIFQMLFSRWLIILKNWIKHCYNIRLLMMLDMNCRFIILRLMRIIRRRWLLMGPIRILFKIYIYVWGSVQMIWLVLNYSCKQSKTWI